MCLSKDMCRAWSRSPHFEYIDIKELTTEGGKSLILPYFPCFKLVMLVKFHVNYIILPEAHEFACPPVS